MNGLPDASLLALFVSSVAAATILPLSSEAVLALVVARAGQWTTPVVVATLGNTLGACTTYWLGRGSRAVAPPPSVRMARAAGLLARFGAPAMLLSWVPVIGDILVALAGAARMPFWHFTAWTLIGKFVRYALIAYAVYRVR